jgi:hypothetical protein
MTTDNTTPRFPVRPPAPGPAVVLDLPALWSAVEERMSREKITELKQLSEHTGVDRTSLGRIRSRARAGDVHQGQRGGVNVNAYLTLVAFVAGSITQTGMTVAATRWDEANSAPYGALADRLKNQE